MTASRLRKVCQIIALRLNQKILAQISEGIWQASLDKLRSQTLERFENPEAQAEILGYQVAHNLELMSLSSGLNLLVQIKISEIKHQARKIFQGKLLMAIVALEIKSWSN